MDLQDAIEHKGASVAPAKATDAQATGAAITSSEATAASEAEPPEVAGVGLYRIIGNCIPGLHAPHQSHINLAYMLAHETAFDGVARHVVINRIVDADERARVLQLLDAYKVPYIEIPFDAQEYAGIGYFLRGLPNSYFWFKRTGPWNRMFRNTAVRTWKNAYLMNNNGARNVALAHGKRRYRWILPWDGNCFLTDAAWDLLGRALHAQGEYKYVLTPMQRADEQAAITASSVADNAVDEPQIAFRHDAGEHFNEERVYGYQPKLELLKRLGDSDSISMKKDLYPWQDLVYEPSPEQGQFITAGTVFRLYSGNPETISNGPNRSYTRGNGIIELIDEVDAHCLAQRLHGAGAEDIDLDELRKRIEVSAYFNSRCFQPGGDVTTLMEEPAPTNRLWALRLVYLFACGELTLANASHLLYQRFSVAENPDLESAAEVVKNLAGVLSMLVACVACGAYKWAIRYQLDLVMLFYHFLDTRARIKGAAADIQWIRLFWDVAVALLAQVFNHDLCHDLRAAGIAAEIPHQRYAIRTAFKRYLALSANNRLYLSDELTPDALYVSEHLQKANGRRIRYILDDFSVRVNHSGQHAQSAIEIVAVANGFLIKRGAYYLSDIRGNYLRWEDHPREWEVFSVAL